jgi:hypothetical protein
MKFALAIPVGDQAYFYGYLGSQGAIYGPEGRFSKPGLSVDTHRVVGNKIYYLAKDEQKNWHLVTPDNDINIGFVDVKSDSFLVTPDGRALALVYKKNSDSYSVIDDAGVNIPIYIDEEVSPEILMFLINGKPWIQKKYVDRVELSRLDGEGSETIYGSPRSVAEVPSGRSFCMVDRSADFDSGGGFGDRDDVRDVPDYLCLQELDGSFEVNGFVGLEQPVEFEGQLLYSGKRNEGDPWCIYNEKNEIVETLPDICTSCRLEVHDGILCRMLTMDPNGTRECHTDYGEVNGYVREVVPFGSLGLARISAGSGISEDRITTLDGVTVKVNCSWLCNIDSANVAYAEKVSAVTKYCRVGVINESDVARSFQDKKYRIPEITTSEQYQDVVDIRRVESLNSALGYFLVIGTIKEGGNIKYVQHLYHYDRETQELERVGT